MALNSEKPDAGEPRPPFTKQLRVKWGDCDPAGVVYTPRFADYVVEASNAFYEHILGTPLQKKLAALDVAAPAKALNLVFHRSLWPDQNFRIEVSVSGIRTRSFDLYMEAKDEEDNLVFSAMLSAVCVFSVVRESRSIPDALKHLLEAHRPPVPC